jgi:NADH dehydrogenase
MDGRRLRRPSTGWSSAAIRQPLPYNPRMRSRNVCILGGSGFVGTHLCASLARAGHRVTVLTRDAERAKHLRVMPSVRVERCDVHDEAQLAAALQGHDAVINLVGILNERGRDGAGFRRAHSALARKVVAVCRQDHIDRLLHMSGLNADADHGPSHYLRSKGEAERAVREEGGPDLKWTIFQPSVIFGSGDSFINRFAGLMRLLPFFLPLARPESRLAPVWIEDVVAAMLRALEDDDTAGESYQLCGPEVLTLRQIVTYVRDQLRLKRRILGLPDLVSRLQAAIMDFVPGKPFSTDNYRSLTVDSVCSVNGFARLGIQPRAMRAIVPRYLGLEGGRSRYALFRRGARR